MSSPLNVLENEMLDYKFIMPKEKLADLVKMTEWYEQSSEMSKLGFEFADRFHQDASEYQHMHFDEFNKVEEGFYVSWFTLKEGVLYANVESEEDPEICQEFAINPA